MLLTPVPREVTFPSSNFHEQRQALLPLEKQVIIADKRCRGPRVCRQGRALCGFSFVKEYLSSLPLRVTVPSKTSEMEQQVVLLRNRQEHNTGVLFRYVLLEF